MKINDLLNQYSRVIAWGTGNYYYKFRNCLPGQIDYFVDNDSEKWQSVLEGKWIFSPSVLKKEKIEGTLIIVCNNYFDEVTIQLQDYGEFDVIDIVNIAIVRENEQDVGCRIGIQEQDTDNLFKSVLICAGIHALWQRNGARKFIDGQMAVLHNHGYQTVEAAPLRYLKKGSYKENYLMISKNRIYIGLFTAEEFVENYVYEAVIIHSLYYGYTVLEQLTVSRVIRGKVLYYLHDYFILCRNRFLFYENKLCLNAKNRLSCHKCKEADSQREILKFHREFFRKSGTVLIAPSLDTKERVERFYRRTPIKVIPHLTFKEEKFLRKKHQKLKIAYLGVAMWQKGWDSFCDIVRNYYVDYEFFCIGDCEERNQKEYVKYVSVELGVEKCLTMREALQRYEIDIAYVGSISPETYSYTYYEACEAGCFVITTDKSGNVSRQVEEDMTGRAFRNMDEMNAWLRCIDKVKVDVASLDKRITDVRADESFIELIG
ncbi:MAG: glycosyltransferase family 4 protein [Dorea sp.]|nr:glycosyltransferase family 4 protein [Dorea sp.]